MESGRTSVDHQGAHKAGGAPRGRGRAPTLVDRVWAPGLVLSVGIFYIFKNKSPLIFRSFRELLFLHKNNTMAVLLKTTSVRVSSIQIMQVRVQNKGKRVWKSRYIGDISAPIYHRRSASTPPTAIAPPMPTRRRKRGGTSYLLNFLISTRK